MLVVDVVDSEGLVLLERLGLDGYVDTSPPDVLMNGKIFDVLKEEEQGLPSLSLAP